MGKLLVIADQDGPGIATTRGLELARRFKRDTEVVAFVYAPLKQLKVSDAERDKIKQRLIEDRREEVQARIDSASGPNQKVRLLVVWEKDLAGWTCKHCDKGGYDMVIKTERRSKSLLAHTSTDWQLLRECPSSVLIVAEKKWSRTKPIMASVDLSTKLPLKKKLNEDIIARSLALANALETSVEIICAIEVPTLLRDLDLVDERKYVNDAKEDMAPNIKALAKKFDIPEKAFHVKKGPAERVIASQAAAKRAQVVVMGTVGRRGVKARLMGSTAERVLRHLKTDVLALKPRSR